MQNKFINRCLILFALTVLGISCDSEDDPAIHGANFEHQVIGAEGKRLQFTNTSANAESAIWLFGDGSNPSNEISPIHQFPANGVYNVELISVGVVNSAPAVSRITIPVTITQPAILVCDLKPAASNYIKNGEFSSNQFWTVNSMSDAGLVDADYSFNSSVNPACANTGNGFKINNLVPFENNGNLIWQSLGVLPVGNYRFSGDVNIVTGESQDPNNANAGKNYFIEAFLVDEEPEDTKSLGGNEANPNIISGFNAWWGGAQNDIPSGIGSFPVLAFPHQDPKFLLGNNRGEFSITESKEYFFALQFGTYSGSYGNGGVSLDNFAIVKLED